MIIKSNPISNFLKGKVIIPGDKSISHRSVIIPAISKGTSRISNILESEDVKRTINALINLGVKIEKKDKKLFIYGNGLRSLVKSNKNLYLGNSGTSARLLIAILSCQYFDTKITGDSSLSKRPMDRIINPLKIMGGKFLSNNNFLPIVIKGKRKLKPIRYNLNIPSAQIKSGVMLASLHVKGKTQIIEKLPTRNHTEIMLKIFGANIKINKYPNKKIITLYGQKELKASNINIPGDFSSAAFFIVAALITKGSSITLKNINLNPTRTGLLKALKEMKGNIKIKNKKIINGEVVGDILVKYSKLEGCKLNKKISPTMIDEFPILAIAAANASSPSKFYNLKELKVKESNRLLAISKNLQKCDVKNIIKNDNLIIFPQNKKSNKVIKINSKKDHRIAMSFAIMGMVSKKGIVINNAEFINTSFPKFIKTINNIGGKISL